MQVRKCLRQCCCFHSSNISPERWGQKVFIYDRISFIFNCVFLLVETQKRVSFCPLPTSFSVLELWHSLVLVCSLPWGMQSFIMVWAPPSPCKLYICFLFGRGIDSFSFIKYIFMFIYVERKYLTSEGMTLLWCNRPAQSAKPPCP